MKIQLKRQYSLIIQMSHKGQMHSQHSEIVSRFSIGCCFQYLWELVFLIFKIISHLLSSSNSSKLETQVDATIVKLCASIYQWTTLLNP